MATDYDAPRRTESDDVDESLRDLSVRTPTAVIDVDEVDPLEAFELPGADVSGEDLVVRIIPKQADEFVCSSCFLVFHRNRVAKKLGDRALCRDCV